jgi:dihydroorotase-like cyclic amidohydrolase
MGTHGRACAPDTPLQNTEGGEGQSALCPAWQVAADMAVLVKEGINSFKFFMAYKGALQVTDEQLLHGLHRCKELGAIAQVHALLRRLAHAS